jgi:hypothetical protein
MRDAPAWIQHALIPLPEDSADLRRALETAAAMWSRGDRVESARWLHHAAHTAHGEGRQQRTTDLAKAASELDRLAREHAEPIASASMRKTTPYQIAPDDITRLVAPDAALLQQAEPSERPHHMDTDPDFHGPPASLPASAAARSARADRPRPPVSSADAEATLAAVRAPPKPIEQTIVMPMFSDPADDTAPQHAPPSPRLESLASESTAAIEPTRTYGSPEPASSSSKQASSAPGTLESPRAPLEPMRAVRVAIEPGSGSRLTLLQLSDGEAAPPGTQEALLVALGQARGST